MNGVSTQVITTHTYSKQIKDSPRFGGGFLFAWNLGLTHCLNIGRGVSSWSNELFKQWWVWHSQHQTANSKRLNRGT